jgi:lipoprotein-releasing system permease protein
MFFLAIRHLISRKKQTTLTLLGILLGTAAYVIISGFMLGFRYYFIDQLINNDAHVRISAKDTLLKEHELDKAFFAKAAHVFWISPPSGRKNDPKLTNPAYWFNVLNNDTQVEAYSPQLSVQVLISKGGSSASVRLLGSVPHNQTKVTTVENMMIQGHFVDLGSGGNRVILGDELLQKLGARVGDTVLISNGKSTPNPFKIIGAFHAGIKTMDEGTIYGSLTDVQNINGTPRQITDIAVRLKDVTYARQKATQWQQFAPETVQSWDQANQNLLDVFKIQDLIRYLMTVSILVVAGFGIYNILNMVVTQKRKEIAILRSMGYESKDILSLFFIQGVILGCIGGVMGLCIGYAICVYLSHLPFTGGPLGSGPKTMIVSFEARIYIYGFMLSFISASLAGLLPAYTAGKLTPIDIIRSES